MQQLEGAQNSTLHWPRLCQACIPALPPQELSPTSVHAVSQHLLQSVSQLPLNSGLAHTHPRHLRGAQQEGCPNTASLMSHSQVLFILPLPFFSNSPLPAAPAVQAWPFLSLLPTALEISLPCCPLLDLD